MSAFMNFMSDIFAVPLGYILSFLYGLTNSYIASLLLITVFVKLCLLPIEIFNRKRTIKTAAFQMKASVIRKKYTEEPWRAQDEIKLLDQPPEKKRSFQLFTLFLQLFVLVGLLNVLNTPLTSILRIDSTDVESMQVVMSDAIEASGESRRIEIVMLGDVEDYKDALLADGCLSEQDYASVIALKEKFGMFGFNFSQKPKMGEFNGLWCFPIAYTAVMLLSNVYSMVVNRRMNKGKKIRGPLAVLEYLPLALTVIYFFLFMFFPVGLTFYFTISGILSFVQRAVLSRVYPAPLPQVVLGQQSNDGVMNIPVSDQEAGNEEAVEGEGSESKVKAVALEPDTTEA